MMETIDTTDKMIRLLDIPQSADMTAGISGNDNPLIGGQAVPRFTGEFWTARQRQASSLQEVSYRACFKPQLPRFFINRFSRPGDRVYDPFSGRGTTALESGLLQRRVIANDVNPLSAILTRPRFHIPDLQKLQTRLHTLPCDSAAVADIDLSMFYHPDTEAELVSLRNWLAERAAGGKEDHLDRWIRMVATNRLTGHSPGFFSVYTLPPNQAVSPQRQLLINRQRGQKPDYRNTRLLILKKSRRLIASLQEVQIANLKPAGKSARFLTGDARHTPQIRSNSVQLTITSPPFLNIVQYAADNWLRCWFNGIDAGEVAAGLTIAATLPAWRRIMQEVFYELHRITRVDGWVAFEVGEIQNGAVRLDEHVVPLGCSAGFTCRGIVINQQQFTKTANIWGIQNNHRGTNTNRIVLFQKKK